MNKTIQYYDQNAEEFISSTIEADMQEARERFLTYVRPGSRILDAGCGSGRDSLAFMKLGYSVDAFDASEEICRLSSEILGFPVSCKRFEELTGESEYDGIWACASLLHVRKENLPDVMERLKKLLKPSGILYASFKEGTAERIKGDRFFHDMTAESCHDLFSESGFDVLEITESEDVRDNRNGEIWINAIGRKK